MHVVVIGGLGQLVLSMQERVNSTTDQFTAIGPPKLDLISSDEKATYDILASLEPHAIVNAAAYTAVDQAESDCSKAFAVNGVGAGVVASAAKRLGVPMVHISTDYAFDGNKTGPYCEGDRTSPSGIYGASKLAGEKAVLESGVDAAMLRTAWLYSPFCANFVKTMLTVANKRDELSVVDDQRGSPTNALDLADACIAVAKHLIEDNDQAHRGLFHATGAGEGSWADLAEAAFVASAAIGGPSALVKPISTADYPTPAKRPLNSRLSCEKLKAAHGIALPDWRKSLPPIVVRLVAELRDQES